MGKRVVHSINYQLPGRIPVCSEVTVKSVGRTGFVFIYFGVEYQFVYDRYTQGSRVPFQQVAQAYFGPNCNRAKIDSLSKIDQEGIASGVAKVGMTKEGVPIAMGRPPFHVNPSLDVGEWLYWRNRFVRTAIQFDASGNWSSSVRSVDARRRASACG